MQLYHKADQYIHWLSQTLAKVNRTFVPKKADDSHTNLYFDALQQKILGRWITTEKGKALLALNVKTLDFEWLNTSNQVLNKISSIGKTILEVEKEVSESLSNFGLDASDFSKKMHYDIPIYDFINEPIEAIETKTLQEWFFYRNLANEKSNLILGSLQVEGDVRVWSHHFDTGIYVTPNERIGIGFGMAMQDTMVGTPYFYVAGYAQKGNLNYENPANLTFGEWKIGEHWKGAVLSIQNVENHQVNTFIKEVFEWYLDF